MIQNLPTSPRSVQHLYHLCFFYFPNYYSASYHFYCISLPDKQNKQSMKKVILAVASIALWASCIEDEKDYSQIIETRVANCETSQDFDVPIKEGYTTFVTYGEDTIAVANEPITIRIPRNTAVSTRAGDGINISYDVLKEGVETTYAKTWQAVMFEDTQNGDYDYNDLIIHVQNTASNHAYQHPDETWQSIKIQPIALGSIKTIKLGCILSDGSEHIISNDVRTDLFSGKQGFINTVDDNTPIRYRLSSTNIQNYAFAKTEQKAAWVAWFIEVDGKRMYAASSDIDYKVYDMVNKENMPYGLAVASGNGTFSYPQEKNSLFETYLGFSDWINGKASSIGSFEKELVYKYCSGGIISEDGKSHKIWDYQDLQ